mmetsp:Transcript_59585/g.96433  ORF Transcript_59585/g.96433 Transcript_59585/m.96433 type:complete len:226 (-) Transcript_59585:835-1512(-)
MGLHVLGVLVRLSALLFALLFALFSTLLSTRLFTLLFTLVLCPQLRLPAACIFLRAVSDVGRVQRLARHVGLDRQRLVRRVGLGLQWSSVGRSGRLSVARPTPGASCDLHAVVPLSIAPVCVGSSSLFGLCFVRRESAARTLATLIADAVVGYGFSFGLSRDGRDCVVWIWAICALLTAAECFCVAHVVIHLVVLIPTLRPVLVGNRVVEFALIGALSLCRRLSV